MAAASGSPTHWADRASDRPRHAGIACCPTLPVCLCACVCLHLYAHPCMVCMLECCRMFWGPISDLWESGFLEKSPCAPPSVLGCKAETCGFRWTQMGQLQDKLYVYQPRCRTLNCRILVMSPWEALGHSWEGEEQEGWSWQKPLNYLTPTLTFSLPNPA